MKRLICLMLAIFLLAALPFPVIATNNLIPVIDNGRVLEENEEKALIDLIAQLRTRYSFDVVILTEQTIGSKDPASYADDYYDRQGFGFGDAYSGVLLLIVMDTRQWAISTCGECRYALTDYGLEVLFSRIAPDLGDNRFYDAFECFLSELPGYFDAYLQGSPIDGDPGYYDGPGYIAPPDRDDVIYYPEREAEMMDYIRICVVSLFFGLAGGGAGLLILRSQMNTAKAMKTANSYLVGGSAHMHRYQDIFLYSHVSRTLRPKNTSGGGGGGSSVHRSSSGRSHGGRSGRF